MIVGEGEEDFEGGGDKMGENEAGIECVAGVGCPVGREMKLGGYT